MTYHPRHAAHRACRGRDCGQPISVMAFASDEYCSIDCAKKAAREMPDARWCGRCDRLNTDEGAMCSHCQRELGWPT